MKEHALFELINEARQRGDRINPNPYFAIEDVALQQKRKQPPRVLSYAAYYARYHTTEERGGWKMENPTGQQVIYIRDQDFLGSSLGRSRDVVP